jgi:hypothetical protein
MTQTAKDLIRVTASIGAYLALGAAALGFLNLCLGAVYIAGQALIGG